MHRSIVMRICLSVFLSISLSIKRVHYDKMTETSATFLYHVKADASSFLIRKMLGGGYRLIPEILDESDTSPSNTAISNLYSVVAC